MKHKKHYLLLLKKILDRRFLLLTVSFILLCSISKIQAQVTVNGTVKDAAGEPLIGVTIKVVDTQVGTASDVDGNFTLTVPSLQSSLHFSYLGYEPIEYPLKGKATVNVILKEETQVLDEFVVIGYGVTKRRDLTGSVSSVNSEDLTRFPASNVTEMLRGQGAGILVTSNVTSPGGAANVAIRGKRSINASNSPLYLVDGMIVPHINDISANDIESIDVLKDASAQAIYGSRASNGVILITTKRGKSGKISVDYNGSVGFQKAHRNFDLYSPDEFTKLRFWAKYNEGTSGIGTPDEINYQTVFDDEKMYNSFLNKNYVDWEDLLVGNAIQYQHSISLRGGSDKMKYSSSIGYLNQDGLVKKSGYERANFRINFDYSPYKWLDLGTSVSYSKSETNSADATFSDILTTPSLAELYDSNGDLNMYVTSLDTNPLLKNKEYKKQQQDEYITLSAFLNFKPFDGFSYRFSANVRSNNREAGDYKSKKYPGSTGEGGISNYDRDSYQIDNVINYILPIKNKDHSLTLTLIQSADQDLQKTTGFEFKNSTTDKFDWNVGADSEITKVTRSINRTKSVSFAGRIQYNLLDRYLLTASIRRDGASVFGAKNKWSNFPSVAAAWRVNEESFLKDKHWIDMLKLRLSYGSVGNWAIPSYRTLGLSESYEYLFGESLGIGYLPVNELKNSSLKWETTSSVNLGLDFSLFNGRIVSTIEYYKSNTHDLLLKRTIPSITGYDRMWDNIAKTESHGWEFTLNGTPVRTKDIEWNIGFSLSTQKNKIKKLDGQVDENGKPVNFVNDKFFVGYPINVDYNYVFDRIWQEGETPSENQYLPGDSEPKPGDIKLADHNGDGVITADDRKIYNLDPKWYATINTSVAYKGFDLYMEFYTVQDVIKNNPYLYSYNQGGSLNGKKNGIKVNYWTPDNKSNEAPRPQYTASVPYFPVLGFEDASYFRLRSATLGYTLPKKITSKFGAEKLRVYATGTNLFTITDYKSYSPEKEPGSYPEAQTFTFGINLSF